MDELKSDWLKQAGTIDLENIRNQDAPWRDAIQEMEPITAQQCIDYALQHCFERASVVSEQKILQTALRFGTGVSTATIEDITALFKADKQIIHVEEKGQMLCTTKKVLAEEKHMVKLAREGFDKHLPLYAYAPELTLGGQQGEAIKHVLTTPHMVSIVRGAAGTGKTALMREAMEKINETGKAMIVVAPTAQASRGVLKTEGFENAETVASLLSNKEKREEVKNQVLWVDEAGLLGTKDMVALLELAKEQNARLILGGDTRQHASVDRGDALRILNTVGGIKSAELNQIRRQQNEAYRLAVEDLAKGDVPAAFAKLDDMDAIHTVEPKEAAKTLARDYVELLKNGKTALVISPTHAQGEEVTHEIRALLQENGLLGKREMTALQYKNLNLTLAEKTDWRNYAEGQAVQFLQNARGIKRGEILTVKTIGEKEVIAIDKDGQEKFLPLHKPEHFDVMAKHEISLAKGDHVRISKNAFDRDGKRMDNGDMMIVLSANKDGVKLQNEKSKSIYSLKNDFGHLAHSYCITSYASQGKSVDKVLIYQPAATFGATNARQFYVSVSRGKDGVLIYTDQKDMLLDYASQLGERQSAIELVDRFAAHKDFVAQFERASMHEKQKHLGKTNIMSREDYEPEI